MNIRNIMTKAIKKAGDKVFHSARGYRDITEPISFSELDNGKMYLADGIGGFFKNGTYKYMQDFGEVFEDHHQAQAYYAEVFRKMTPRGDKPCNQ